MSEWWVSEHKDEDRTTHVYARVECELVKWWECNKCGIYLQAYHIEPSNDCEQQCPACGGYAVVGRIDPIPTSP